ncbi:MAG: hypothetical protein AB7Q45_15375, partial [Planctomycetaceae bacterium]
MPDDVVQSPQSAMSDPRAAFRACLQNQHLRREGAKNRKDSLVGWFNSLTSECDKTDLFTRLGVSAALRRKLECFSWQRHPRIVFRHLKTPSERRHDRSAGKVLNVKTVRSCTTVPGPMR